MTCAAPVTLPQRKNRDGFTLIEISVVLVIIGLIIGGIMVGRDMIRTAELRSDISMKDKFIMAINVFRGKYNCLPGDCTEGATLFPNPPDAYGGSFSGNGNGQIDGIDPSQPNYIWWYGPAPTEIQMVNENLAMANLIPLAPFPLDNSGYYPGVGWIKTSCKYCGLMAHSYNGVNYVWMNVAAFYPGSGAPLYFGSGQSGGYTPADAFYIDNKIDDGLPRSGSVQSPLRLDWTGVGNYYGCQFMGEDGGTWVNQYNFTLHDNVWFPGQHFPDPCGLVIVNAF